MNVKSCDDSAHSSMDRTVELPQNYQIVKTPYGGNDPEESIDVDCDMQEIDEGQAFCNNVTEENKEIDDSVDNTFIKTFNNVINQVMLSSPERTANKHNLETRLIHTKETQERFDTLNQYQNATYNLTARKVSSNSKKGNSRINHNKNKYLLNSNALLSANQNNYSPKFITSNSPQQSSMNKSQSKLNRYMNMNSNKLTSSQQNFDTKTKHMQMILNNPNPNQNQFLFQEDQDTFQEIYNTAWYGGGGSLANGIGHNIQMLQNINNLEGDGILEQTYSESPGSEDRCSKALSGKKTNAYFGGKNSIGSRQANNNKRLDTQSSNGKSSQKTLYQAKSQRILDRLSIKGASSALVNQITPRKLNMPLNPNYSIGGINQIFNKNSTNMNQQVKASVISGGSSMQPSSAASGFNGGYSQPDSNANSNNATVIYQNPYMSRPKMAQNAFQATNGFINSNRNGMSDSMKTDSNLGGQCVQQHMTIKNNYSSNNNFTQAQMNFRASCQLDRSLGDSHCNSGRTTRKQSQNHIMLINRHDPTIAITHSPLKDYNNIHGEDMVGFQVLRTEGMATEPSTIMNKSTLHGNKQLSANRNKDNSSKKDLHDNQIMILSQQQMLLNNGNREQQEDSSKQQDKIIKRFIKGEITLEQAQKLDKQITRQKVTQRSGSSNSNHNQPNDQNLDPKTKQNIIENFNKRMDEAHKQKMLKKQQLEIYSQNGNAIINSRELSEHYINDAFNSNITSVNHNINSGSNRFDNTFTKNLTKNSLNISDNKSVHGLRAANQTHADFEAFMKRQNQHLENKEEFVKQKQQQQMIQEIAMGQQSLKRVKSQKNNLNKYNYDKQSQLSYISKQKSDQSIDRFEINQSKDQIKLTMSIDKKNKVLLNTGPEVGSMQNGIITSNLARKSFNSNNNQTHNESTKKMIDTSPAKSVGKNTSQMKDSSIQGSTLRQPSLLPQNSQISTNCSIRQSILTQGASNSTKKQPQSKDSKPGHNAHAYSNDSNLNHIEMVNKNLTKIKQKSSLVNASHAPLPRPNNQDTKSLKKLTSNKNLLTTNTANSNINQSSSVNNMSNYGTQFNSQKERINQKEKQVPGQRLSNYNFPSNPVSPTKPLINQLNTNGNTSSANNLIKQQQQQPTKEQQLKSQIIFLDLLKEDIHKYRAERQITDDYLNKPLNHDQFKDIMSHVYMIEKGSHKSSELYQSLSADINKTTGSVVPVSIQTIQDFLQLILTEQVGNGKNVNAESIEKLKKKYRVYFILRQDQLRAKHVQKKMTMNLQAQRLSNQIELEKKFSPQLSQKSLHLSQRSRENSLKRLQNVAGQNNDGLNSPTEQTLKQKVSIYEHFKYLDQLKKMQLEQLRNQKLEDETKSCTFKPEIISRQSNSYNNSQKFDSVKMQDTLDDIACFDNSEVEEVSGESDESLEYIKSQKNIDLLSQQQLSNNQNKIEFRSASKKSSRLDQDLSPIAPIKNLNINESISERTNEDEIIAAIDIPMLHVDVKHGPNDEITRLSIYQGDNVVKIVTQFAIKYGLTLDIREKLINYVQAQIVQLKRERREILRQSTLKQIM
ncbi:UNKNOWN [Stylonychia lemnae]|uniref:Uncharacterized protein n=1 Tax=Stylonychia lemnae TaxID=5949 RepID=A0A078BAG8_STYLE|nr:UNKNOWN [Stylonychia lemnae]|eukprot:CDW91221.1 UNKNOWN [Stylonychia lemnae]